MAFLVRLAAALMSFGAICGDEVILSTHDDDHEAEPIAPERILPTHWAGNRDYELFYPPANVNSTKYQDKLKV